MNQDELRERQRRRVKRRYYQAIHSLSRSRELVQQLTDQHRRLLEQQQTATIELSDGRDHALRRYTEATTLADQLRTEKQRLLELVEEREKLQDRLMTLLDESKRDQVRTRPEDAAYPSISFRPLTLTECEEITRSTFADIQLFLDKDSYVSTNGSVLGWRDKREMTGGVVKIALEKVLDGFTPFDLGLQTWQLLQGQLLFTKCFSESLDASMQCLQVVNDTNTVLLTNFASFGQKSALRALFLGTFVKVDWGYAVLFQSFDRTQFEVRTSVECEDEWLDVHLCYLFRASEAEETRTHTLVGGKLAGTSVDAMKAWLLEQLLVCLRWENRIIGPRALISSE